MSSDKLYKPGSSGYEPVSGRVVFDERGNAIWDTQSIRKLEHPGLSLTDEELAAAANGPARPNVKGARIGYDPYQSGMLQKKKADKPKKKDLRALSKWIKMQKELKSDDE
jgi:hypothetical protein